MSNRSPKIVQIKNITVWIDDPLDHDNRPSWTFQGAGAWSQIDEFIQTVIKRLPANLEKEPWTHVEWTWQDGTTFNLDAEITAYAEASTGDNLAAWLICDLREDDETRKQAQHMLDRYQIGDIDASLARPKLSDTQQTG